MSDRRDASKRPEGGIVFAYRALGLGDFLTAVPALKGLRRAFPRADLVLAGRRSLAALALHTELVDRVIATEPFRVVDLGGRDVGLGVNLHGRGPQSHAVVLGVHPRRLIAWEHPLVAMSYGMPRWRRDEHEVARWCRLLTTCGVPADPADLGIEPPAAEVPQWAHGATLLHPGAESPARRWPPERFAAVARSERAQDRAVVVTGSPEESGLAHDVAQAAGLPAASVVAGRTSVMELAAFVAVAGRVICGDTGVAHLATALATPSVVLFGPTSPRHWGPPARSIHRVLWAGTTGDPHGAAPDLGLLSIQVSDVIEALAGLGQSEQLVGAGRGESRGRGTA
jgi:ADP-heptose:LPS heptosyltransferase